METTQIHLNKNIVDKAITYARQRGLNLSSIIEDYLDRLVQQPKANEESIPDIVLSLLGAAAPLDTDDLNGRKAYHQYLEEKYQ